MSPGKTFFFHFHKTLERKRFRSGIILTWTALNQVNKTLYTSRVSDIKSLTQVTICSPSCRKQLRQVNSYMYQLFPAEVKTKGMFIPAFLLCRGMTRWGEYADLHQIDEMAETPQDIVVTSPLPGCVFHPNLLPVFNYTPSPDLLLLLL